MSYFHFRSIPATAWPAVPGPYTAQVLALYRQLDRTQWLSPAEIESLQLQQLNVLLDHCLRHVPYYAGLIADAGLSLPVASLADYRKLPTLTREIYQAQSDAIKARQLPPGMTPAGESYTSGTTGVPIKIFHTNQVGMFWNACYLRDLEWAGFDPRGKLAGIRMLTLDKKTLPQCLEGVTSTYWTKFSQALDDHGPAFGMDIRQDPRKQLDWLQRIQPDYLVSLPTNLEFLALLLRETGGKIPSLRAIQTMGEPLPLDARQRIQSAFGVPVKNIYGATECGYIASDCPQGHGLHVFSENVLTEILDPNDQPCLPGQTGRLVLTALHNFLTPLLRYEILDDVTLAPAPGTAPGTAPAPGTASQSDPSPEPASPSPSPKAQALPCLGPSACPCGRGLPLWLNVDGRKHPFIRLPDGKRKNSAGLTLYLRKVGGARQFQFIQRALDHAVVRVVPDHTWTHDHAQRMRQIVHDEFGFPIRVDIEVKDFLERPQGGKLRMIVIEVPDSPTTSNPP